MDACNLLTRIIHGIYIATCTIPRWVQLKSSASITTVYTKNDTASFLVYTVIIGLQEKKWEFAKSILSTMKYQFAEIRMYKSC